MHPGDKEEAEIREMECGLDPQRDVEQSGPECDIPPPLPTEGVQFEASFPKPMLSEPAYTAGPSEPAYTAGPSEPFFTEPSHTEIPSQAPHAPNHVPWMDLSAQINSLGTRMEELAVVNDTCFYSMEDRIDQYQTGFTSQFELLDQRLGRMDQQHEEMMAYLRSVFPPPPL